jgi:glycosyltransferase involved in cell wall biosynthesis
MPPAKKNVLICGYDFPPIGGPASLRLTSYVSRLPSLGWTPHVVTVREDQGIIEDRDPELAARLPAECRIHRTDLVEAHTNPVYRLLTGSSSKQTDMVEPDASLNEAEPPRPHGVGATLKDLIESVVLPDRVAGWIPFAVRECLNIIRDEPIDAILTTSPPVSTNIVGLILRVRTGIPWVAEFRDPWTQYAFAQHRFPPFDRIETGMERQVLFRSSRVVCTTDAMVRGFMSMYPELDRSKFKLISGFYEEKKFARVRPTPQDKFTLIFPGHLYEDFAPNTLFEGLATALSQRPGMRARTNCLFVGRQYEGLDALIERWGLEGVVERRGFVSNDEALSLLLGSHVAFYRVSWSLVVAARTSKRGRSIRAQTSPCASTRRSRRTPPARP